MTNPTASLTDEQRRIVAWEDGPLVVIAGAGTGKTRVIVERVRRLLETKGPPHNAADAAAGDPRLLEGAVDHLKADRSEREILFELLLKLGLDLWVPIERREIAGEEVHAVGDATCVFRDSAFADDVAKTNLAAILKQHGLTRVRSL